MPSISLVNPELPGEQGLGSLGLASLLSTEDLELLFKRYERAGEFNHLVFLRDLDEAEKKVEAELASPARYRTPAILFNMNADSPKPTVAFTA